MPLKEFRFTGLTGGIYASANPFDQPKGTLPYLVNMLMTRRGGLRTVDGSHITCSPAGDAPYPTIPFMAQYNPAGVSGTVPHLLGITLDDAFTATVIDISDATWEGIFASGGPYPNAGPSVSAVQFSNSMVFALGLNVLPQLYDPIQQPNIVGIANTFQSGTTYPPWLSNTNYGKGDKVLGAPVGSSISYIWQALNGGTSVIGGPPVWVATYKAKVQDNNIVWQNKGPAGAEAPLGAGFVFNHLNSLWVWGTAPTYMNTGPNAGIDGPDSLRMSDSGNPTSFDPSNQDFIGQGDGQQAMGGGTFSLLEVGIPATAQLILYKTKSTYSVIGAFPDVTIAEIPDGVGCAAPNTNQLVPGIGMMRLSLFGVAVFNGTRDVVDQFTDPIRPFLFPEDSGIGFVGQDITPVDWNNIYRATATQTVNPPGYLLLVPLVGSNGALTRGFFFDRLLKAWTVIDFPDGMQLSGSLFNIASSAQGATFVSGFADGKIRQIFAGDEQWDTDSPNATMVQWRFRYPAVGAPNSPLYYRRGMFRAALRGSAANLRSCYVRYTERNGMELQDDLPLEVDATQLSQAIDIDKTVLGGMLFDIFGQGRVLAMGIGIQYEPKAPTRIPG